MNSEDARLITANNLLRFSIGIALVFLHCQLPPIIKAVWDYINDVIAVPVKPIRYGHCGRAAITRSKFHCHGGDSVA